VDVPVGRAIKPNVQTPGLNCLDNGRQYIIRQRFLVEHRQIGENDHAAVKSSHWHRQPERLYGHAQAVWRTATGDSEDESELSHPLAILPFTILLLYFYGITQDTKNKPFSKKAFNNTVMLFLHNLKH
jgi:hypothetical protein